MDSVHPAFIANFGVRLWLMFKDEILEELRATPGTGPQNGFAWYGEFILPEGIPVGDETTAF